MSLFNLMVAFFLTTLLLACGNQQDAEDYSRMKTNADMAKMKSAEGVYSGYILRKKNKANLGAVVLTLTVATEEPKPAANPGAAAGAAVQNISGLTGPQPILRSSLKYVGLSSAVLDIGAQSSSYSSDTGQYQTDITFQVPDATGAANAAISISGMINESSMVGSVLARIAHENFDEEGATIELKRVSFSVDKREELFRLLALQKPTTGSDRDLPTAFTGVSEFKTLVNGKVAVEKLPVNFLLTPTARTSEREFFELLSPRRTLQATVSWGEDTAVNFKNCYLDLNSGRLNAQVDVHFNDDIVLGLICDLGHTSADCQLQTPRISGPVAVMNQLKPVVGSVPNFRDDPDRRKTIVKEFNGEETTQHHPWKLTATEKSKTLKEHIADLVYPVNSDQLDLSLVRSDMPGLSLTFLAARFESNNGELNQSANQGATNLPFSIHCANFFFDQQKPGQSFTCDVTGGSPVHYLHYIFR